MKEEDWPVIMEPSCETLFMCIITTLKEGVRSGGGISDVLRKPAASVSVCVCVLGRGEEEGGGEIWWRDRGEVEREGRKGEWWRGEVFVGKCIHF